jgi:hypothetical protein
MAADESDDEKTQTRIVLTKGTMVSHYRIVEKIGAGGIGKGVSMGEREKDC